MDRNIILRVGETRENMITVPTPSSLSIGLQDVDAATTTRTADGSIHRDRICGGASAKRKLELEWAYLGGETARYILTAFSAEFFYVQYYDPYLNDLRIAEFYAGDRSVPMYNANLRGNGVLWEAVKFNIIER